VCTGRESTDVREVQVEGDEEAPLGADPPPQRVILLARQAFVVDAIDVVTCLPQHRCMYAPEVFVQLD